MIPSPLLLVLLTGATYGWAWVVTQSSLLSAARLSVRAVPLLGELVQCIACTGAWVGLGLWWLAGLLEPSPLLITPLAVGWSVFACWSLGRLLGDAD